MPSCFADRVQELVEGHATPLLLPVTVQDFVDKDHLARFVVDLTVEHLNLREIEAAYTSERGQPPFDPAMMTALLLYAYCSGVYSSRRIAITRARRLHEHCLSRRGSTARRSRRTPPSIRR